MYSIKEIELSPVIVGIIHDRDPRPKRRFLSKGLLIILPRLLISCSCHVPTFFAPDCSSTINRPVRIWTDDDRRGSSRLDQT